MIVYYQATSYSPKRYANLSSAVSFGADEAQLRADLDDHGA